MTTRSLVESLFGDDPFFLDDFPLFEGRGGVAERLLQRRARILEGFNLDGLVGDLLRDLGDFSPASSSSYSSSSSSTLFRSKPDPPSADPAPDSAPVTEGLPDLEDPPALPGTQTDDSQSLQISTRPPSPPPPPQPSSSSPPGPILSVQTRGASPDDLCVTLTGRELEVRVGEAPVRRAELPPRVHPSTLTCTLGADGVLRVESEGAEPTRGERAVPVRFRTEMDLSMNARE